MKTPAEIALQTMSEYLAPESETDDQDIQQMIESAIQADRAQRNTRMAKESA